MLCCLLLLLFTSPRARKVIGLLAFLLAVLAGAPLEAAETVTIELIGGRNFTGLVDPRTSDEQLWLRFYKGKIVIRRPFAWDQLAGAEMKGEALSTQELRGRLVGDQAVTTEPVPAPVAESPQLPPSPEPQAEREITSRVPQPEPLGPVCSINFEASVANWDQDVENDGLLVYVYPLDCTGNLVPAAGTLEVELVGGGAGNPSLPETFPTLGRWVQVVTPQDLTPRGYAFRLPFQAIHPEFNLQVGPVGLAHARLAVPGMGVFEATTNTISVRPVNPMRDRLQVQQGSRFLPNERTGQSIQPATVQP